MRARTSCLTTLRWRSLARFRRPFHARLAKASAAPVAPLLSIGSPLLDTRQNICSRCEAVNNALSSISRESCIEDCVELKGGTFGSRMATLHQHSVNEPSLAEPVVIGQMTRRLHTLTSF